MSAATKQERLSYGELCQLKWLLGGLLALVSLWTLFGLEQKGGLILWLAAISLVMIIGIPHLPGLISEKAWKFATPALIAIIVSDFTFSRPDFIGPLIRMILLLLLVRALQYRRKREDLQLILLCLFTMIISGVLTLSLGFAVQLIIFAPVAMVLLLIINLAEARDPEVALPDGLWKGFSWLHLLRRVIAVLDLRLVGLSGLMFLGVAAISTVLFVVMPRISLDHQLPFLNLNAQTRSGFSDTISYSSVGDIRQSNAVAFRVDFSEGARPPSTPYWRMVVMDEYLLDSQGRSAWRTSGPARPLETIESNRVEANWPREGSPEELGDWTFYLEGGVSDYLPSVGYAQAVRFQGRQSLFANRVLRQWRMKNVSSRALFFQWLSVEPQDTVPASLADRERIGQVIATGAQAHNYKNGTPRLEYPRTTLALPDGPGNSERLRALAAELAGGRAVDAREFSLLAARYLARNHDYSLQFEIPGGSGHPLVRWIFSDAPGYCELYAGAFTLMARAAGFPARVVGGYMGGTLNGFEEYYTVRQREAHAWAEIYDAKTETWLRVDPTPGSMAVGSGTAEATARTLMVDRGWTAYLDSLRVVWYRRIVNFDDTIQEEMANQMRDFSLGFAAAFKDELKARLESLRHWLASPWNSGKFITMLAWSLLAITAVVVLRCMPRWLSDARIGRIRIAPDAVRIRAGKLVARFREGAPDFDAIEQLTPEGWEAVYGELLRLRFGPKEGRPASAPIFKSAKRQLRLRARG